MFFATLLLRLLCYGAILYTMLFLLEAYLPALVCILRIIIRSMKDDLLTM